MHENDHLPPSNAQVKTQYNWIFSFPMPPSSEEGQLYFMCVCVCVFICIELQLSQHTQVEE